MAKFIFQLEGVLRHRQNIEREHQRALAREMQKVSELEARLHALDREMQDATQTMRETHLIGRLDMNLLSAHRRYTLAMQRKGLALAQEIAAAQIEAEKARAVLLEQVKKRKALEKLRETYHTRWQADQNRRELSQQDEIVTQMSYRMLMEETDGDSSRAFDSSAAPGGAES